MNVLLIISEDHGQHLGCYGDPCASTPALDQLAAEGLLFENHHTTQAVCSPGRASIFTGLFPHQCGQIGLATHRYAQVRAFDNLFSLASRHGLRTGLIGKLHVNPEVDFPRDLWWNDSEYISFRNRDVHRIAAEAEAFITASSQPFLLTVAFPDAHLPFLDQQCGVPSQPVGPDDVAVPPQVGIDTPRLRQHAASYYNCMSRLDVGVDLLLDRLQASGKAEGTLVVFTTDHGAQFSRGKTCCYEGGLRVPLLVRGPGVSAGTTRTELTSHVDLLPTIAEILEVESPSTAGRSLAPLLRCESASWRPHLCAEWTAANPPCYYPQRSIRSERYKLIVNYLSDRPSPSALGYSGPGQLWKPGATEEEIAAADPAVRAAYATYRNPPPEELYDLQADPWEFDNRIDHASLAAVRDELRAGLSQWQAETDDRIADPEVLDRLTREHDAICARYYAEGAIRTSEAFGWSYGEYLA
jgi:N-sulfoglucosamine sulfohydrolase